MHCVNEKELLLLYYKEIPDDKRATIIEHLAVCETCKEKYQQVIFCLEKFDAGRLHLTSDELESVMVRVHEKLDAATSWQVLYEKIASGVAAVRMGLLYRPQLIPVLVVLFLMLSLVPFSTHRQQGLEGQFDILQIQMELSLEDDNVSIFDLYEEAPVLYEETSRTMTSLYG